MPGLLWKPQYGDVEELVLESPGRPEEGLGLGSPVSL